MHGGQPDQIVMPDSLTTHIIGDARGHCLLHQHLPAGQAGACSAARPLPQTHNGGRARFRQLEGLRHRRGWPVSTLAGACMRGVCMKGACIIRDNVAGSMAKAQG